MLRIADVARSLYPTKREDGKPRWQGGLPPGGRGLTLEWEAGRDLHPAKRVR
jgi:hypothetical protein